MKKLLSLVCGLFCLLLTANSSPIVITVKASSYLTSNYGTPNIHIWGDYSTEWPGEQLIPIGDDLYTYTFAENVSSINCVINFEGYIKTIDIMDITSSVCYELGDYEGGEYISYGEMVCPEQSPEIEYKDPFQKAVIHEDISVDTIIFINDQNYPWVYQNGYIRSTNKSINYSKSELSFTYTSKYQTQVQFEWKNFYSNSYYHMLDLYVDGVYWNSNTSSDAWSQQFFLSAGTHIITFKDSVATNSYNYDYISGVHNIRVREVRPLEELILAPNSMPVKFQNDETYPWTLENGGIVNGNYWHKSSLSSFFTEFTIDKPCLLEFDCRAYQSNTYANNSNDQNLFVVVDGAGVSNWLTYNQNEWAHRTTILAPGKHRVEWGYWIGSYDDHCFGYVRNISLRSDFTEVELEYAGTLGVEVLYKHDVLTDVKALKIKGNLNDADWETIKNMTNLSGLDLSEASFSYVPAYQFQNLSSLSYVVLSEGVQTIGDYAFDNTMLWNLHIPSTVTSIGEYAFKNTSQLVEVTFAENSQLQNVGKRCFYQSGLQKIALPNSVTSIGEYCFYKCSSLNTLILSDALTSLPDYACYECTNLSYVHFSQSLYAIGSQCFYNATQLNHIKLPESLRSIDDHAFYSCISLDSLCLPIKLTSLGEYAFYKCTSLKYIELPSSASIGYYRTFYYCTAVQTVMCPSATPPSVEDDPFYSASEKSTITLMVPSVSVVSYKLDPYWYQFGSIVEGEDPDYWMISGELVLNNNRRISGKPDVYITRGGSLVVGGAAPMSMGSFIFDCSSTSTATLLNTCPFMTADSASVDYYINEANKWYFLSPLYDVDILKTWHGNNAQYVFRYYNAANRANYGTGSSWQNVTDGVLHQGQGYILHSNGKGWMFMPALNHSDSLLFRYEDAEVSLQTYASENVANENWNFIGNPYPAYYDIWYMDFSAPITVWTGSTYKAYSLADDNYALRPMEAFFVQKPDAVDKIIFHKEGRQTSSSVSHSNAAGAPQRILSHNANRYVYNLKITADNGMSDETRVVINEEASLAYEMTCDASKFMTMDSNCPQLFTVDNYSNRLAINERPYKDGKVTLGVQLPVVGEYIIDAVSTPGITLIDNQTGVCHDIHSTPYIFTTDTKGENIERFVLQFEPLHIITGVENVETQSDIQGSYVYTIDGRIIGFLPVSSNVQSLHLPIGVYMVRSGNAFTKIVVR